MPMDRQPITRISTPTDMRMAILMGKPAGMTMNTKVATALTVIDISISIVSQHQRAATARKRRVEQSAHSVLN